jgi:hypothetical protein
MTVANVPPDLVDQQSQLSGGQGRLSARSRLLLVGGSLCLLSMLAIAGRLTPDERGYGTHEQLLLMAPCGFMSWTGLACPTCGMTTSWSWLARGNLSAACQANPLGCALGVFSVVLSPWMMASGLRGRWLGVAPTTQIALGFLIGIGALGLLQWLARIAGA